MHLLAIDMRRRVGPLALTLLLTAVACKSGDADGAGASASGDASTEVASPVARAYLAIQDKLARDDIDGLDVLAADMVTALEEVAGEPGVDTMLAGAGRVGAQDIDTARAAFRKLSHGMLEYMRAHPEARRGLTVIHCPMTFDGEGAPWVQVDGPVMNPYEGSMMLHCGSQADWDWKPDSR